MQIDDVLAELKILYRDGLCYADQERHLDEGDVNRWASACDRSRREFFDEIALALALGSQQGDLSYEFCDAVVNDLFGPVTDTLPPRPTVFWNVYEAFDEGEYYHGNNRDEDPVEVYTKPLIARMLSERS